MVEGLIALPQFTRVWGVTFSTIPPEALFTKMEMYKLQSYIILFIRLFCKCDLFTVTVDWEILALQIIRPLNFRIKNMLSFDGSTTQREYAL